MIVFPTTPATPAPAFDDVERWRVIVPPTFRPVTSDEVCEHLRWDGNEGEAFYTLRIDAAAQYAEEAMGLALCEQTIAAVFNEGEPLTLPRGPLLGITSVKGANGATIQTSGVEHAGHSTTVRLKGAAAYPVTVVYRAGYASAAAIPADIRLAILQHVATMYEVRESTSDKPRTAVPHSLEAFYARRNRSRGIG